MSSTFNSKTKKSIVISVLTVLIVIFLFPTTNTKLKRKLNKNAELSAKYDRFKAEGYQKEFRLPKERLEAVIDTAMTFLGVPNRVGGVDRDSIDASGLIYVSINKNFDVKFPRIAQDMARYGKIITDIQNLKRGDLVFFFDTYEVDRIITSVGLYLGENKFINSSTNEGVSVSEIDDPYYWKNKFFFGTRIFK